jgi:PAS domain S-box-containing protein
MDPALAGVPQWQTLMHTPLPAAASVEFRLVFINEPMLELLHVDVDALLGPDGWLPVLFPDGVDRASALDVAARIRSSNEVIRHRQEIACGDGVRRAVDLTTAGIVMPDGARGALTIAVDRSGELPSGARGNRDGSSRIGEGGGERSFAELVEDAPDLILRVDALSGRMLYINRAAERMTGHPPRDFYRDAGLFTRLILPEQRPLWDASFSRMQETGPRTFDLVLTARSGARIVLQMSLYPVKDGAGRMTVLEGVARDNTTVRQLEEIRQRNQERASLDRLKTQLLANVSHELRTPLVSIKGYNDLLLRGTLGPINARQKRGLEIAAANTQRLIELIETLLELARREEGRLELTSERFDLRDAVSAAAGAVAERLATRSLPLLVDLGEEPLPVIGDRARLEQVFRALLGNAEKFTEGPGGAIDVIARRRHEVGEWVEVDVVDRGIGIPVDARAHIFDRFFQVDASPTRRFGGAGLGLALARELVMLHGGEITVDSAEGRGSTFTVRLPLAGASLEREPVAGGRALVLAGADATLQARLGPLLESPALQPIDLLWAASPAELVRRARRHRPDIVILGLDPPPPIAQIEQTLEALKRDDETAQLPVVVVADVRGPVGRADLVVGPDDAARLTEGVQRLLGRGAARPPGRPRVVLVEDEPEIMDFMRFVLEREGYDVVSASSGEAALAAVDARTDLVILDIVLEDADGIEVCRHLKSSELTARVPVLMVTAMSGDAVQKGSLAAGADGYLMKPFGLDEFLQKVRLHLRAEHPIARESA